MTREKPAILAHRGALLNAPENTIAAFKPAFSNTKQFLYAAKCAAPDIGIAVMPFFPYNIVNAAGAAGASAVCTGWTPSWPGTRELFKLGARVFDLKLQAAEARARGLER